MSDTVTRNIRVQVRSEYVPEQSSPMQGHYFFSYHVTVSNEGQEVVQLMSRHWVITDANGAVKDVRGAGVVGEKPILASGESFEYTSACPLPTPVGTMHGTYQMVTRAGEWFDVEIAPFSLADQYAFN